MNHIPTCTEFYAVGVECWWDERDNRKRLHIMSPLNISHFSGENNIWVLWEAVVRMMSSALRPYDPVIFKFGF